MKKKSKTEAAIRRSERERITEELRNMDATSLVGDGWSERELALVQIALLLASDVIEDRTGYKGTAQADL